MQKISNRFVLSSQDLVGQLNCERSIALDIEVANGMRSKPHSTNSMLDRLRLLGEEHENAYIQHLTDQGFDVVEVPGVGIDQDAVKATTLAMSHGRDVITQAALATTRWSGRADVLVKVEGTCDFGDWAYEAVDTKLSQNTKGNTILQLCLYSELLGEAQGQVPEHFHVVTPFSEFRPETYRFAEYDAYYRQARKATERATERQAQDLIPYPDPCAHCEICKWQKDCDLKRRNDDHLSLVAGISKGQINTLNSAGISTLDGLALTNGLQELEIKQAQREGFERLRKQASEQYQSKNLETPTHTLLSLSTNIGLAKLPTPSAGDVFFDFEGDQWLGEGGLEFLFGYYFQNGEGQWEHKADWALSRDAERAALEQFIDFLTERAILYPDFHIYHFGHYEQSALKRLTSRYSTRAVELDDLLRSERFVDLFTITRQSLIAGVESYSIKKLEALYGFKREAALKDANQALDFLYLNSQLGSVGEVDDDTKQKIAAYNKDDCISTLALREWLERERSKLVAQGQTIARPAPTEPSENKAREKDLETKALADALLVGISEEMDNRSKEEQARFILAHLLSWHRREERVDWQEFYRLVDLPDDELLHEMPGISGLILEKQVGETPSGIPIHRYSFPSQDSDIRVGDGLKAAAQVDALNPLNAKRDNDLGTCSDVSLEEGWIEIKKTKKTRDKHPSSVFRFQSFRHDNHKKALQRIAQSVIDTGFSASSEHSCAIELLLHNPLRYRSDDIASLQIADPIKNAQMKVRALDRSTLAIQGPPGTGKSYTAARMICALVKDGNSIGVTSNSHSVILSLLNAIQEATLSEKAEVRITHWRSGENDPVDGITFAASDKDFLASVEESTFDVYGSTTFEWTKHAHEKKLDFLFVDEAGQVSLANVLAASQAAENLVLLGDPQQLDQPTKAAHPDGCEHSALQHLIGDSKTLTESQGLFLEKTFRLPPSICTYISELFYDGKLSSVTGCDGQKLIGESPIGQHGLRYLEVPHTGNVNNSPEEVVAVSALVESLMTANLSWQNRDSATKPLTLNDLLIIAPYNAQVNALKKQLPENARIGTVDKFQGQQAPITIYSMATSSYEDAPRGMEFLYSANRLNVAVSRAQCVSILVCSPALFEPTCYTPRQIQLANGLCRYKETADRYIHRNTS